MSTEHSFRVISQKFFLGAIIVGLMVWQSPFLAEAGAGPNTGAETLTTVTMVACLPRDGWDTQTKTGLDIGLTDSEQAAAGASPVKSLRKGTRRGIEWISRDRVTHMNRKAKTVRARLPIDRHLAGILAAAGYRGHRPSHTSQKYVKAGVPLAIDRHFAGILAAAGYSGRPTPEASGETMTASAFLPIDRHFAGILAAAGYGGQHVAAASWESLASGVHLAIDRHLAGILAAAGYDGGRVAGNPRQITTGPRNVVRVAKPHKVDSGEWLTKISH